MQITGRNLQLVYDALDLAIAEAHNMIATCPDVTVYADEIVEYEMQKQKFQRLRGRIERAIAKEKGNA